MANIFRIQNFTRLAAAIIVALAVLSVAAWRAGTWFDDTALTVWVFDVGQGDAIFIDAPTKQILIDGGRDATVLEKLSAVLPPWDRSIDVMIATHPHADHVRGLNRVLEAYDVGEVVTSGVSYGEVPAIAFQKLVGDATVATAGMTWDLGHGARLDVVWPATAMEGAVLDNVHEGNVVTLLTYGGTTVLLTGDVEQAEEDQFVRGLPHVDVLKVGHHGSDTSTGFSLLNITSPTYAVISVGKENDYGHPSNLVVDRLRRAGAVVLRTDLDGDIRIRSTGGEPDVARIGL